MTTRMRTGPVLAAALALGTVTLLAAPRDIQAALRVCADPGNMPLSNNRGEGIENKMAAVLHARSTPPSNITTGRASSAG